MSISKEIRHQIFDFKHQSAILDRHLDVRDDAHQGGGRRRRCRRCVGIQLVTPWATREGHIQVPGAALVGPGTPGTSRSWSLEVHMEVHWVWWSTTRMPRDGMRDGELEEGRCRGGRRGRGCPKQGGGHCGACGGARARSRHRQPPM